MASYAMPDALDRRILEELRADARSSFREIARRIGSTTPTVAARVRRMEDTGLIAGYRVVVRGAAEPDDRPAPWTCVHCGGPFHGPARARRVAGRHYAFCCRGCEDAFVQRYRRAASG
jgi:DNA-binding Lrp family transcriptional regulator